MATLDAVCTAIPAVLSAAIDDIECYEFVADAVVVPAIIVWPQEGEWATMGRGIDVHQIDLYVLVSRPVADEGQSALRRFIHEVRAAIWNSRDLSLASTDAHIAGYSRFGGSFEVAQIPHVGVVLRLVVRTSGT